MHPYVIKVDFDDEKMIWLGKHVNELVGLEYYIQGTGLTQKSIKNGETICEFQA